MSTTGPNEGTLLVNPMLQLSTAYYLLRPFFMPRSITHPNTSVFLDNSNWQLEPETTSLMQGPHPGHGQELNSVLHPHLRLSTSMVHIPKINPGDYVAWHCDSKLFVLSHFSNSSIFPKTNPRIAIHAVDSRHLGHSDSSVLYIPTTPLTISNAGYLKRQCEAFLHGYPAPDFPGGKGESEHHGLPTEEFLRKHAYVDALRGMGLERWNEEDNMLTETKRSVLRRANEILGFSK